MEFLNWARGQWDRVAAAVGGVVGAVALLLGWIGVSGTTNPAGQIPYLVSGGLVAIFLAIMASTLWLSADLRDEWRKLDRLEQRLGGGQVTSHLTLGASPAGEAGPLDDDGQASQRLHVATGDRLVANRGS